MLLLATLLAMGDAPEIPATLPDCTTSQLALSLDGGDGDFNGMSHSGTWLVLRNQSAQSCRLAALPRIQFYTGNKLLTATRQPPPGMHPGPVMLPLTLAPGAAARTGLRWVSGQVFDGGHCLTATRVTVTLDAQSLSQPLTATLCAAVRQPARFTQDALQPMP